MIESNVMHVNGFSARRFVLSVEGDVVTYILPISVKRRACTVAEFLAWKAAQPSDGD